MKMRMLGLQVLRVLMAGFGLLLLLISAPLYAQPATTVRAAEGLSVGAAETGAVSPVAWLPLVIDDLPLDYRDDFNSASSGWTTHTADCCLVDFPGYPCDDSREHLSYKYSLFYQGGYYKVNIPCDCRSGECAGGPQHGDTRHIYPLSLAPGVLRPTTQTCLQVRGIFEGVETIDDPYWSFWGLAFAASEDMSTIYSLDVNNLGDWNVLRRSGYQYPGPNHPYKYEEREELSSWNNGRKPPADPFKPDNKWNTLGARIVGSQVKLYINGVQVMSFTRSEISSLRWVGIIGGDWEVAPTQIKYDYFFVDEGCDTWWTW